MKKLLFAVSILLFFTCCYKGNESKDISLPAENPPAANLEEADKDGANEESFVEQNGFDEAYVVPALNNEDLNEAEKALVEQIKRFDYSNVKYYDDRSLEEADIALPVPTDWDEYSKRVEWATCFLNENGLNGLILQEKEYTTKPIR